LFDQQRSAAPVSDPELSLSDAGVGAQKSATAPLGSAPGLERLAIGAAVALQLCILVGMLFGRTVPYIGAQTVLLKVEPVDPRDLFRGDYVTLNYGITRTPGGRFAPGQSVFVTLVPEADGRHYHAGEFLEQAPAGGLFIKGTAQGTGRATYGIESYYVQEGTGHDYEAAVRNRRLWAEVALDSNGNGQLQRLIIE
jgi:uncharacterized membrane-anchored protein